MSDVRSCTKWACPTKGKAKEVVPAFSVRKFCNPKHRGLHVHPQDDNGEALPPPILLLGAVPHNPMASPPPLLPTYNVLC